MAEVSIEQVQAVLDDIGSRKKITTSAGIDKAPSGGEILLRSLLSKAIHYYHVEILQTRVPYKVLQAIISLLKDGLLEQQGQLFFETVEEMFLLEAKEANPQIKTSLQEIAGGLFSHACSILQNSNHLIVPYLNFLLKAMLRDGTPRWNAYSCCGPLLMSRLDAFKPFATTLIQIMLGFPETLSVIHNLYEIAPLAFVESMNVLVKLYESNVNGQLSILDIVRDLARHHPEAVAPYLAALQKIAVGGSKPADIVVVKEIETSCANVVLEDSGSEASSIHEASPEPAEPEDFDERVVLCNQLAASSKDMPSLRDFLQHRRGSAARYLRHVGQVMPLPCGIESDHAKSPEAVRSFSVQFKCGIGGPNCVTRANPLSIITDSPLSWIKLAVVMFAHDPSESFPIKIPDLPPGDTLDSLLALAVAVKGKDHGFEVLSRPFLGTDDLADLIVDLRVDGIFSSFHLDIGRAVYACAECSPVLNHNNVQRSNVSGYLLKKGRRLGREVKRYYMLDEKHLLYCLSDHRVDKPKRRIPVTEIGAVREVSPTNVFEITRRKQKRVITLRATSQEEATKWVQAIGAVIAASPLSKSQSVSPLSKSQTIS